MKIDKKRRREYKTNYKKRLVLLKGNCLRLVIRKSNKYILLQIVESKHAKDKILYSVKTKELLKHGWREKRKLEINKCCIFSRIAFRSKS